MTFPTMDLAAATLAASAAVDCWRRGSIFALARARVEDRGGRWAELLGCRYCLSFWAGLYFLIYVALAGALDRDPGIVALLLRTLLRGIVYALAIYRLLILELDLRGLGP